MNDQYPFSGSVESFSDGKKEFEGNVKDGLREGLWVYYYPSGQKKSEGCFKNGVKNGTWNYYAENGSSLGTENYKDGTRLGNQVMPEEGDTTAPEEGVELVS
ncbi:MAG: hypothetical protein FJY10_01600 [Bacteroidetes bacterium]|nr:hypothetical protein [Bacteroidota bacterium]